MEKMGASQCVNKLSCQSHDDKVAWRCAIGAGHPTERPPTWDQDDDMRHAWRNPIDTWELDEDLTMLIGPSQAAQMLEVGVVASDDGPVIVHAMPARPKFLRRR